MKTKAYAHIDIKIVALIASNIRKSDKRILRQKTNYGH